MDNAVSYPVRLWVIDRDELPIQVDMYKESNQYFFIPVANDGTHLPRNPNLENPDPILGRILEESNTFEGKLQYIEPDENLGGKKMAGTNIDSFVKLKQTLSRSSTKSQRKNEKNDTNSPPEITLQGFSRFVGPDSTEKARDRKEVTSQSSPALFATIQSTTPLPITVLSNLLQDTDSSDTESSAGTAAANAVRRTSNYRMTTTFPPDILLNSLPSKLKSGPIFRKGRVIGGPLGGRKDRKEKTMLLSQNQMQRLLEGLETSGTHPQLKDADGWIVKHIPGIAVPKYAKIVNVKSGNKKVVVVLISNKNNKINVTATRNIIPNAKQPLEAGNDKRMENITCLTIPSLISRKESMSGIYLRKQDSCPQDFPVGADLAVSQWVSQSYLADIFQQLSNSKLEIIKSTFQNCVQDRGIAIKLSPDEIASCEKRMKDVVDCLVVAQRKGICNADKYAAIKDLLVL